MTLTKRRLVDVELVGIDCALHDIFAEAVDTGDENDVPKAGFGVEREDYAAGRCVGPHHLHDADRQRHFEMVEPVVDPIGNGAVGED